MMYSVLESLIINLVSARLPTYAKFSPGALVRPKLKNMLYSSCICEHTHDETLEHTGWIWPTIRLK